MAIRRGRGVAAINYPTGMNLGGDPTQALVHSTPTGNFMVTLSSVDLGQGMKQIMAQICAETIGVPTDRVVVDTADTDTGPHCMGTFASRGTHRAGNAVIQAAREARQVMLEVAAEELEVNASDLETDGQGNILVKGAPQKSISIFDVALSAHFKRGRSISGRGMFLIPRSYPEKETGAMKPSTCYAHACTVAEVEVDPEGVGSDLIHAFHLEEHLAGLHARDVVLDITLTATHTNFERLLADRHIRKHADPDLAAALHVAGHRATRGFDLSRRHARAAGRLQAELAEGNVAAALCQAVIAAFELLAVLGAFWLEHDCLSSSVRPAPVRRLRSPRQVPRRQPQPGHRPRPPPAAPARPCQTLRL